MAFLLRNTAGWMVDAFVGHRNSAAAATHSLSSIIDADYTSLTDDGDNVFDGGTVNYVLIGGSSTTVNHRWDTILPEPVNAQRQYGDGCRDF